MYDNDFQVLCVGLGCLQAEYEVQANTSSDPHWAREYADSNDLVYLRARYYNDETGTFLSLDPAEGSMNNPMSLNGYSYAHDNPVNRTDPSGLFPIGGTALAALFNSTFCMDQSQLLESQVVDCSCHGIFAFLCPSSLFPPCSTPQSPFATNTPPPLFPTNTAAPTITPIPPTPSATPIGDLRREAITLAVFQEARSLTAQDRDVVVFVILNRENFPGSYDSIEQALGSSQIAGGILNNFSGDRTTQINNAYAWYPSHGYAADFQTADTFVRNFFANPPADFTQGAIQFTHAASQADAQQIAQQMNQLGQTTVENIIRGAGVNPIVNGTSMYAGSVNRTVYINMNIQPPSSP